MAAFDALKNKLNGDDEDQNSFVSPVQYQEGGLNPSLPPQQFLGQILNKTVGDEKPKDGDEGIRPSISPIDVLPYGELGSLAANGVKAAGSAIAEAAPRVLGNEIGAIGSDVSQASPTLNALKALANKPDQELTMADRISQAAQNSKVKVVPSEADIEAAKFAQQAQSQPKFGEALQSPGRNIPDQKMAQYQDYLRNQAFQERNAKQLAAKQDPTTSKLAQLLRGNK